MKDGKKPPHVLQSYFVSSSITGGIHVKVNYLATWRNGSAFGFDRRDVLLLTRRLQVRVLRWSALVSFYFQPILLVQSLLVYFGKYSTDRFYCNYNRPIFGAVTSVPMHHQ